MTTELEINCEGKAECDGCGRAIADGSPRVFNIESCCGGGCWRVLCRPCIQWAATLMKGLE